MFHNIARNCSTYQTIIWSDSIPMTETISVEISPLSWNASTWFVFNGILVAQRIISKNISIFLSEIKNCWSILYIISTFKKKIQVSSLSTQTYNKLIKTNNSIIRKKSIIPPRISSFVILKWILHSRPKKTSKEYTVKRLIYKLTVNSLAGEVHCSVGNQKLCKQIEQSALGYFQ